MSIPRVRFWPRGALGLFPPAAIVVGCAALLVRPLASHAAVLLTVGVGTVGILGAGVVASRGREAAEHPNAWGAALAIGIAAFGLARLLGGSLPSPSLWLPAVASNMLAAVAEEAFFRGLVFGWVLSLNDSGASGPRPAPGGTSGRWAPGGVPAAVFGSALLFAAVHVPVYGWRVFPLDTAAGLLLAWQRWATGGWSAPAVTHVAANLLQMI